MFQNIGLGRHLPVDKSISNTVKEDIESNPMRKS